MSDFTPGPWDVQSDGQIWCDDHPIVEKLCTGPWGDEATDLLTGKHFLAHHWGTVAVDEAKANARLIAAAPDHADIGWAMCVAAGRWEPWGDGRGEFVLNGIRFSTKLDVFGVPEVTPPLRLQIAKARGDAQ